MIKKTFFIIIAIVMVLVIMQILFNNKKWLFLSSLTPLEAGFESISLMTVIYSSPFLFMIILFVIFDLEILFLIPLLMNSINSIFIMKMLLILFWFILMSLMFEWKISGLNWQY